MDMMKPPLGMTGTETPRFTVPGVAEARMERRRNDRLRILMDQMARANSNGNGEPGDGQPAIHALARNTLLNKDDLIALQAVNDEPDYDDRRQGERLSADEAGDDLPLFNPLKKDISI